MLAFGDFERRRDNGVGEVVVELAELTVRFGAGSLEVAEGVDHRGRDWFERDGKVVHGPRGGGSVEGVGRDLHFAHSVAFDAVGHERLRV